jgi:cysteine desulfurase
MEEVKIAMIEAMNECFANSSSIHTPGVQAIKKVEKARHSIANSLNASPEEFYFTSGGTESNNWVLKSAVMNRDLKRKKIVTSAIEHPSIMAPLKWVQENFGIEVLKVGVDASGKIKLAELAQVLNEDVFLCTLMHVNNEVGSVQPIEEVSRLCARHAIPLHVDACQSFIKLPLDLRMVELTYLTINAHKLHGPKGIGALYMRKGHELPPLMLGGGHEMNFRSGTLNVPAIIGFGKAVALQQKMPEQIHEMSQQLKWLGDELKNNYSHCRINGSEVDRAPHILNVHFKGNLGKDIFWALNKAGIAVSTSSACSSNKMTPSHVLAAMGMEDEANLEALRISIGLQTKREDLEILIHELKGIIK